MSLRCIDECERYAAEHIKECSAAVLLYEIEGKVICPTFALLVVMCLDWISPNVVNLSMFYAWHGHILTALAFGVGILVTFVIRGLVKKERAAILTPPSPRSPE